MPEEFKDALAAGQHTHAEQASRPAAPTFVAGGTLGYQDHYRNRDRDDHSTRDRTISDRPTGYAGPSALTAQNEPEYSTVEEAEAAFFKLLRRAGVQPDWTWPQAMRAVVKDPQYRAIKDPKDRQTAFEKYVAEFRAQEQEREKERQAKLRNDFFMMLSRHPEIKYYSRWKTVRPIIASETIFKSAKTDEERETFFIEYRDDLYKNHVANEDAKKKAGLDELAALLKTMNLKFDTKWQEAQTLILENEHFKTDDRFLILTQMDILKTVEVHIKALERQNNEDRQQQKLLKQRQERKNRDSFKDLLQELKSSGKIKAGSNWCDIYDDIVDDPRYDNMLGQTGSSPLDLFWEVVVEEDKKLEATLQEVKDTLRAARFNVTPKTSLEEFMSIVRTDRRISHINRVSMEAIFNRLHDDELRRDEEDKRHAERKHHDAIDDLRSKIRRLDPPVTLSDTWEKVRPRVEKSKEYKVLKTDELRRAAFEKHLRRLKEKEHGKESRRRSVDRDHRNGHSPRRRHTSHTPEYDAYEEHRRKAQADRERQYQRSSMSRISPAPRHRDERDRYERANPSRPTSSHYDPRERSNLHRSTARNPESELDYDNEAPARDDSREPRGIKRRRESDENRMVGDQIDFCDPMNESYSFGSPVYGDDSPAGVSQTRSCSPSASWGLDLEASELLQNFVRNHSEHELIGQIGHTTSEIIPREDLLSPREVTIRHS